MERKTEAKTRELRTSRERLYTVLDSIDAAVSVSDMETREILFANKYLVDLFGDVVGRRCWQVLRAGQSGPCASCTNDRLLNADGEPNGAHDWEYQNTVNGRWYEIRNRAIRWEGGRIARLEVAIDITEHKHAQERIRRDSRTQSVVNSLLRLSLEDIPLDELLERALDLVLSIPWLAIESQGGIFVVQDDPETLVLRVQRGLGEALQRECAQLAFGRCVCGRAALTQEVQFAAGFDDRHQIRYEGMAPHGHYCVPVVAAGRALGVINLYVREGHRRDQREEEFLLAIANTLAGIILRRQAEEEGHRSLEETARGQRLLLALSGAAQAVQRARTPDQVYHTVGEEVKRLGYDAIVLSPADDQLSLVVSHLTFEPSSLQAAERLAGVTQQDFSLAIQPGDIHAQVLTEGRTTFFEDVSELLIESLPGLERRMVARTAAALGLKQAIYAPLIAGGGAGPQTSYLCSVDSRRWLVRPAHHCRHRLEGDRCSRRERVRQSGGHRY